MAGLLWAGAPSHATTLLWSFPTSEPILASPVVAPDGTIYIGSYDRKLYALTPTGSNLWSFTLPQPVYIWYGTYTGIYGTPAVGPDGTVYLPGENGRLHALNPTNGTERWRYPTVYVENALYTSPAIGPDGTIYFAFYSRDLLAVSPDGTRKWSARLGGDIFASPAVGLDGTVYCGTDDGKVYAVNPADGTLRWTFDTGPYAITASPAIGTNGVLYIGSGSSLNPRFFAIGPDGTTNWVFHTGSRVRSSAALGPEGTIYFGSDDQRLYALNPDGSKRWEFLAGGAVGSSPAVTRDGTVVFGCDDGKLYGLTPDGTERWSFATTNRIFSSPAIGPDGTIYFAGRDGRLYALQGDQPAALSSWPMFRHDPQRTARAQAVVTGAELAVTPGDGLSSAGPLGGPFSPPARTYTLTNIGSTALDWSASLTQPWLSLSASNGSLAAGASTNVTVSLNLEANVLAPGTYTGTVGFTNTTTGAGNTSRSVSLTVHSPGVLAVSPSSLLSFSGHLGGPFAPTNHFYTPTNAGGWALDWTASTSAAWLTLSPTSGTLAPGATVLLQVRLTTNANLLPVGTHLTQITFNQTGSSQPALRRDLALQIYPPPLWQALRWESPTTFSATLRSVPGWRYVIETSEDLRHWTPWATNQAGPDGWLQFTDHQTATHPRRFFRAVAAP